MIFLENISGKKAPVLTEFSIKRMGDILYCHFSAYDSSLNSFGDKDNDKLYNGDVVEIFVDVGEPNSYLEIEVAPNGARFVANIINKEIHFIDSSFVKTNVKVKGKDYFVDMEIDLSKYHPRTIEYNAYRVETKGIRTNYILLALNPTLCETFHVRKSFIEL